MGDASPVPVAPRTGTLLCVSVPDPVLAAIRANGYRVVVSCFSDLSSSESHTLLSCADILLLDATSGERHVIETARGLRSAVCLSGVSCPILCFSTAHRNPRFVIEIEKCGARYVRITDPALLLEAIELIFAEISSIARVGPCFSISHRFSQGSCAPGEEIAAVTLLHRGDLFQLHLALSSRFVFNYLAQNRISALDAFQIVSGLNGWFYRENARNSGSRQTVKIRVATIKVLVNRIRRAMLAAFAEAGLSCDPYDVLRSFPVEGSARVLYKLRADIRWDH